ncbi:hypothetical protein [uncultured Cetobacterium sp.]|uniref:FomA family porin-like outer membrane protein n=1 Tax=uncultured Cetobacterium sp. TaxID=527638 RepID=UPI00261B2009|nr:hypothetical protein [uncultured Cetobacterium sp.]
MKKLSIILGSILISGSLLGSDEFVPNGSLNFTQTFYGNSGKYKTENAHPSVGLSYSLTENLSFGLNWDRTFNTYNYDGEMDEQNNDYSSPYGTVNYNHGRVGNTKIKWSSSFQLKNENAFQGPNQMFATMESTFDFVDYLPKNSYISPTQFALSPTYIHGWNSSGASGHVNTGALGLLTNWNLPMDFTLTVNAYVLKDWYNGDFIIENEAGREYKDMTYFGFYAWLNYSKELYKFNSKTNLMFNFTGGYDPYIVSDRSASGWFPFIFGDYQYEWLEPTVENGDYSNSYILFALPQLEINYNLSRDITMSLFAQIKYSNQVWGDTEKDWEVQPQGGFSLTYNF